MREDILDPDGCGRSRSVHHGSTGGAELKAKRVTDKMSTVVVRIGGVSQRTDVADMLSQEGSQGRLGYRHFRVSPSGL